MTREELRDYVDEQRTLDNIPYHVYSALIDGIDTLEQEPVIDKIRDEIEKEIIPRNSDQYDYEAKWQNMGLRMALKVIGKYKAYKGTEHWISAADHYICPVCGLIVVNPNHFIGRRCPQCGFQDKKDKEQEDGNE